jgi:cell division protein FtsB
MTFQIFFDKLFWLIISLVSGLFVLITKIWAKSFVSECENKLLISEKKIREDFMESLKKSQDQLRSEMKDLKKEVSDQLEKIDRHQQGNSLQTLSYLEQFKNILNQKQ